VVPAPKPEATARRFAAALEGCAPIATAPELVDAAARVEPALRELLAAGAGSGNRLLASLQFWALFDTPDPRPSFLDLQHTLRLALVRGRVALASHEVPTAWTLRT